MAEVAQAADTQPVQGPDGKKYQFPKGTTKEQAVSYFKKKGITGTQKTSDYETKVPLSIPTPFGKDIKFTASPKQIGETLPMVGGAIGGMTLGVGGAMVGGAAGEIGKAEIARRTGGETDTADIFWGALKQGAYELMPRVAFSGGKAIIDRAAGKTAAKVGETIAGVKMPETYGQASGRPGGFTQTVEHYLSKTFLGGPLKEVKASQEAGSRMILGKLAGAPEGDTSTIAGHWANATQTTRALADPLYASLSEIPANDAAKVAQELLESDVKLSGKARAALGKLGANPLDEIAQGLGYKTATEAENKMGKGMWQSYADRVSSEIGFKQSTGTVKDAILARSELRDLALHSTDRQERKAAWEAWESMNNAIDKGLTPDQRAVKQEADLLYRRSYIMEDMAKQFDKMERTQAPGSPKVVSISAFNKMVNDLAKAPVGRTPEGEVVHYPSKLNILFERPEDRKAVVQLADFMNNKYATMGGKAGISESIARIGVALEALGIPLAAMSGHEYAAAAGAAHLAVFYGLSKMLANPGGAALLNAYFHSSGAAATALATRIASQMYGDTEDSGARKPVAHGAP